VILANLRGGRRWIGNEPLVRHGFSAWTGAIVVMGRPVVEGLPDTAIIVGMPANPIPATQEMDDLTC
jgi:hypothetical protein